MGGTSEPAAQGLSTVPARVLGGEQACHCVVRAQGLALTSDFPRELLLHGASDTDQIW